MGFFESLFGIDILGTGKPGMLDDAVILGMIEEEYGNGCRGDDFDEEDEAVASGAIDETLDF